MGGGGGGEGTSGARVGGGGSRGTLNDCRIPVTDLATPPLTPNPAPCRLPSCSPGENSVPALSGANRIEVDVAESEGRAGCSVRSGEGSRGQRSLSRSWWGLREWRVCEYVFWWTGRSSLGTVSPGTVTQVRY